MDDVSEHLVNYEYKGSTRTMLVKRIGLGVAIEVYFVIRSPKGARNIQKFKGKWHVISPLAMNDNLLQVIGKAIETANIL